MVFYPYLEPLINQAMVCLEVLEYNVQISLQWYRYSKKTFPLSTICFKEGQVTYRITSEIRKPGSTLQV